LNGDRNTVTCAGWLSVVVVGTVSEVGGSVGATVGGGLVDGDGGIVVEPVVSALHAEIKRSPSTMRARRRLEGIRQLTTRPDGHRAGAAAPGSYSGRLVASCSNHRVWRADG
jgi:hypothetical protein